ncbi:MAG: iron-sulfur cluster assembly scaffold protein [Bryobacterales bacterium]|nr:iron-sulfur cluster assembly scaffold protein [Bryobacterales bacterium]
MYSELLLEHFKNPRNVGELEDPAVRVTAENPICGDTLRLAVRWQEARVAEVRYKVRGCTASIAAGSALSEWMQGRTRAELQGLNAAAVEELVGGLSNESKHVAVLMVDGVKALLRASVP